MERGVGGEVAEPAGLCNVHYYNITEIKGQFIKERSGEQSALAEAAHDPYFAGIFCAARILLSLH
jgi:hypothetical protein